MCSQRGLILPGFLVVGRRHYYDGTADPVLPEGLIEPIILLDRVVEPAEGLRRGFTLLPGLNPNLGQTDLDYRLRCVRPVVDPLGRYRPNNAEFSHTCLLKPSNAGVQRDGVVERVGRYACGPDESRSISEGAVAE